MSGVPVPGSPGSDGSSSVVMSVGAWVTWFLRVVFTHDVKVVFLKLVNIEIQAFLEN